MIVCTGPEVAASGKVRVAIDELVNVKISTRMETGQPATVDGTSICRSSVHFIRQTRKA